MNGDIALDGIRRRKLALPNLHLLNLLHGENVRERQLNLREHLRLNLQWLGRLDRATRRIIHWRALPQLQ